MEELLKDLNLEQLESIKVKYPKYAELVDKEVTKRHEAELAVQAKLDEALAKEEAEEKLTTTFTKAVSKVFGDNFPFTNLLIRMEEVEVEDGEAEPVEVTQEDGSIEVEERRPKHKENRLVVYKNVYWSQTQEVKKSTSTAKGSREVSVNKIVNGKSVEFLCFEHGEQASAYFGIPKDKQSANTRLANYKGHAGTRYLVDYGYQEGATRYVAPTS